ncbi:MAG: hypothetical protein CBC09_07810 [Cellvibrionales bacterium TMED49]|nr:hypothetical protein [Porticoccaceae bacterium]OUU36961.1 MAG: hypothetical protein CBC09_07810 [Cellvibrionales bacterium TMED49]
MLSSIKRFFEERIVESEDEKLVNEHLAVAALLIEVMIIDGDLADTELKTITKSLKELLDIKTNDLNDLIELSKKEVSAATSLYQFTRQINESYNIDKKIQLMTTLWRVAYADGRLDKYEENIIRRIADLIHIRHSEYIKCKMIAKQPD